MKRDKGIKKKGGRNAASESHALQVFGALGTGDPQVRLIQRPGFAAGIVGLMSVVQDNGALNTLVADLIKLDNYIHQNKNRLPDSTASLRTHIETVAGDEFTGIVSHLLDMIDSENIGGGINMLAEYNEQDLNRLYLTLVRSARTEELGLPHEIHYALTLLSNMINMGITRKKIR